MEPRTRARYGRRMKPSGTRIAVAATTLLTVVSCGSREVVNETRLIEIHGDRAYLCLSNAINTSDPPSCGADIGTKDNPELNGRSVPDLISVLEGRSESVTVTAREEDGRWFLQAFEAPE